MTHDIDLARLKTALMNAVSPVDYVHADCPKCRHKFEQDNGEWLLWCGMKEHAEEILKACRAVCDQRDKLQSELAAYKAECDTQTKYLKDCDEERNTLRNELAAARKRIERMEEIAREALPFNRRECFADDMAGLNAYIWHDEFCKSAIEADDKENADG